MTEQITITMNKEIAQMLAKFLLNHGYEWHRYYDDTAGITRDSYFRSIPSLESRQAWLELVSLLEETADKPTTPVTY